MIKNVSDVEFVRAFVQELLGKWWCVNLLVKFPNVICFSKQNKIRHHSKMPIQLFFEKSL